MNENQPTDSDVVFHTRMELRVFANDLGGVTMIQSDALGNQPDMIVIDPRDIEAVVTALRKAKREAK